MPIQQSQRGCTRCGQPTLHVRNDGAVTFTEFMLALLVTVITCFLALPVFILIVLCRIPTPWRCQLCGEAHQPKKPAAADLGFAEICIIGTLAAFLIIVLVYWLGS